LWIAGISCCAASNALYSSARSLMGLPFVR
jgi:hypothetical protein